MARVFLARYDAQADILDYNLETGTFRRCTPQDIPKGDQPDRGFFAEEAGTIFGLAGSADGPVFFENRLRTSLRQGQHSVTIREGAQSTRFALLDGGEEISSTWYPTTLPTYTTPYDQDDDPPEFFKWLRDGLVEEGFFTWHTHAPGHA